MEHMDMDTSSSVALIPEEKKEEDSEFKLSNRGNKLTGEENPGSFRPKIWSNKRSKSNEEEVEDFETCEKMFIRKIKYDSSTSSDVPFVRFLNEFEAQKGLFSREGIELDKIFKDENLAVRPLSRYTLRALKSRHLEVLVTLLMLKIEEEQEEYRKLMRLAEELCIEDFNFIKRDGSDVQEVDEDIEMAEGSVLEKELFQRDSTTTTGLEGVEPEDVLQLKALCHEHLHLKRLYISTLRKIRSAAVYSLFQANNLYQKLNRLDRKLAPTRQTSEDEEDEEDTVKV